MKEEKFNTVGEFLNFICPWGDDPKLQGFIFRGHSNEHYELVPTALRAQSVDFLWNVSGIGKPIDPQHQWESWQFKAEYNVLRTFYRLADQRGLEVPASLRVRSNLAQENDMIGLVGPHQQDVWIPPDLHETAALAQHYGMPTRLLDWTYDVFVSMYFAFRGAIGKSGNLAVWALNKEYLSYLRVTVNRVNVEFITPHYSVNPNLNAQKGLFTLWPVVKKSMYECSEELMLSGPSLVDRRPLDELIMGGKSAMDGIPLFRKFVLPCSEAEEGCRILDKLGYDSSRIFPGYDGVAKQLRERYKYKL
jgi:hypothetical protein